MFSFPVTIPSRNNESVFPVHVSINVDDILLVKPLLDNEPPFGVECGSPDMIPLAEIVFIDGRRLPVLETASIIHCYLDAYLAIEDFYTIEHSVAVNERVEQLADEVDNVVHLFKDKPCAISAGSIPD